MIGVVTVCEYLYEKGIMFPLIYQNVPFSVSVIYAEILPIWWRL